MPRAKLLDTTQERDLGELRRGDVVDLDQATFDRFKAIGLVEATDEFPHRAVAAEPRFAAPDQPVYDAMVTRPVPVPPADANVGNFIGGTPPGVSHPLNVAPEIALKLHQQEQEIKRLQAMLAGTPAPEGDDAKAPVDGLTEKQQEALIAAGYDDAAKVAAASDEDLAKAGLSKAAIAKLRG